MIRADRYLPSTAVSSWLNYGNSSITVSSSEFTVELDAGNTSSYPGSGATWTDLSRNSRNATLVGSPSYTTTTGGELNFSSGSSYATLTAGNFSYGTGQFTVEAWVNPRGTQVTNNTIFCSQSSNSSGFYGLGYNITSGWFFTSFDGTNRPAAFFSQVPTLDNWYHVVGTRNSSNTLTIYVNAIAGLTTATTSLSFSSADPRIGVNPASSGESWNGRISIVRLYPRALTYEQVIEKYNWNRQRFGK